MDAAEQIVRDRYEGKYVTLPITGGRSDNNEAVVALPKQKVCVHQRILLTLLNICYIFAILVTKHL
jgi:hypothetical protein